MKEPQQRKGLLWLFFFLDSTGNTPTERACKLKIHVLYWSNNNQERGISIMKKILAILLTLTLMLGLVACGNDADKVAEYVNQNGAALKSTMEESFATSSGMTCTSTLKAEGCKIVMYININELQDVDATTKAQMQAAYDAMDSYFDSAFDLMEQELPELDAFVVNVCEKDGTLLATITMD